MKSAQLRNLRAEWISLVGQNQMDNVNAEILKLSMKTGKLEMNDINKA